MNAKKCKQIRAILLKSGVNWRDAQYKVGSGNRFFTDHVTLDRNCGRAQYGWVKSAHEVGTV